MIEQATTTNGMTPAILPTPRFREKIKEGLRLRRNIELRLTELRQLERQAEMQLYGVRAAIVELEAQLEKAAPLPTPPTPPAN